MTESEAKDWLRAISATQSESNHTSSLEIRKEALYMAIQALEEIQQYRAIGTVEEFKELKEKDTAKKPSPIDYKKYIDVIENAKFLRGACWCPNCKHTVRSGVYCDDCGQKLDWE